MNNHPRYIWLEENESDELVWTTNPTTGLAIKYKLVSMCKKVNRSIPRIYLDSGWCGKVGCYDREWCEDLVFDQCEFCNRKPIAYERVEK